MDTPIIDWESLDIEQVTELRDAAQREMDIRDRLTVNATIAALIAEHGNRDIAWKLADKGWTALNMADPVNTPAPEYTAKTERGDLYWPEGFCRLKDGRIAFHGHFGETVVMPDEQAE